MLSFILKLSKFLLQKRLIDMYSKSALLKNKMRIRLAFLFIFLILQSSSCFCEEPFSKNIKKLEDYIYYFKMKQRIPGLAIAIVKGDQIVYAKGFGIAHASGRHVSENTPFILGSTSKSFTALAVMQLVEKGKINLDSPVKKYLPWFQIGDDKKSSFITIRHLLNHTSGIPNIAGEETLSIDDSSSNALRLQVSELKNYNLVHNPGLVCEYADANYQIAGLIVESVSGESYGAYLQKHIFDPLEMHNSFTNKFKAKKNGLAQGYRYWFSIPFPTNNMPYPYKQVPSGFIICSAENFAHALIAYLNSGRYKDRVIISPEGLRELHRPVLDNYAMGWGVNNGVLWHDGAVQDFGSQIVVDPEHRLGIVVLFNVNHSRAAKPLYILAPNILNLLTGKGVFAIPARKSYINILIIQLTILGFVILWIIFSLSKFKLWRRDFSKCPAGFNKVLWLTIPVLIELSLVLYLINQMPKGLKNALTFEPDITIVILFNLSLLISYSIVWSIFLLRLRSPFGKYSLSE